MMKKIMEGVARAKAASGKPKTSKGVTPKFQAAKPGDRPLKNMLNASRKGQAQKPASGGAFKSKMAGMGSLKGKK